MDRRFQKFATVLTGMLIALTIAVLVAVSAHPSFAEEIASESASSFDSESLDSATDETGHSDELVEQVEEEPEDVAEEPGSSNEGIEQPADEIEEEAEGTAPAAEEKIVAPQEDAAISSTEMLVIFQEGTSEETIAETIQTAETADPNGEMVDVESGELDNSYVLETPMDEVVVSVVIDEETSFEEAAAEIAASDDVLFVQPNYIYSLNEYSSESMEGDGLEVQAVKPEWYLSAIKAPAAWKLLNHSANITSVAVIDTGCDMSHIDLQANIDRTHAATMTSSTAYTTGTCTDTNGHGTRVCGIIGATSTNDVGIMGVGGTHVRVIPINVFWQSGGKTDTKTVVGAYGYLMSIAGTTNLRVINMSIGGYENSDNDKAMHNAIAKALNERGIITVVSGGNSGSSRNSWPSDYDECISVTSVTPDIVRASFSDYNSAKDIAAPGSSIKSTARNGEYVTGDGTSFAAPMVSGALALIFAADPSLSAEQARQILYSTATDIDSAGYDARTGHGLVNAEAAVRAALPATPAPAPSPIKVNVPVAKTGLVYNGTEQAGISAGTGYTVSGSSATNAGTYRATVKLGEGYIWSDGTSAEKSVPWSIAAAPIEHASISAISDQTFSGKAVTPTPTVKLGSMNLKPGTDFSISYKNNAAVGTATVTITGKGNYTGTKTATFKIVAPTPKPDPNRPIADGTYLIESSLQAGLLVDVSGQSKKSGGNIATWRSNGGTNQQFKVIWDSKTKAYIIQNVNSGLLLDVSGASKQSGANVIQWSSNGGLNQRWKIVADGRGYRILSANNTALALNVASSYARAGVNINVSTATGGVSQRFFFKDTSAASGFSAAWRTVENGIYTMAPAHAPNLLFDINGCSRSGGANMIIWTPNGGKNQQFRLIWNGNYGYYNVQCVHSGLYLDVNGASTKAGTNIIQWKYNGGLNQFWDLRKSGDSYILVSAMKPNLVLDINGVSKAPGARAIIWTENGGANQRFSLNAV